MGADDRAQSVPQAQGRAATSTRQRGERIDSREADLRQSRNAQSEVPESPAQRKGRASICSSHTQAGAVAPARPDHRTVRLERAVASASMTQTSRALRRRGLSRDDQRRTVRVAGRANRRRGANRTRQP